MRLVALARKADTANKCNALLRNPSITIDVSGLPTEVLLFPWGKVETSKGTFTLDRAGAEQALAAFARASVDLMIDLNHMSVDSAALAMRVDSQDARGWASLRLGTKGLYLSNIRWTPDGRERILSRKQRYLSPTFFTDESGRIVEILNVALVPMPATYSAVPLIAASRLNLSKGTPTVDPELINKALEVISSGDANGALEVLASIVSAAAGGGMPAEAPAETEDPSASTPDEVTALREEVAALRAEKLSADTAKRADLVGELVKLGVEWPATAWADSASRTPVARLAAEPLEELSARVSKVRALKAVELSKRTTARVSPPNTGKQLSARDQANLAKITDPAARERFLAARTRSTL